MPEYLDEKRVMSLLIAARILQWTDHESEDIEEMARSLFKDAADRRKSVAVGAPEFVPPPSAPTPEAPDYFPEDEVIVVMDEEGLDALPVGTKVKSIPDYFLDGVACEDQERSGHYHYVKTEEGLWKGVLSRFSPRQLLEVEGTLIIVNPEILYED